MNRKKSPLIKHYVYLFVCVMLSICSLSAQDTSNNDRRNQVVLNPDGSKTIITYSVNDQGQNIKTVTNVKVTKFLDGSRLIIKSIKIYDLVNNEETLFKSFTQSSIIRARRRDYRKINNNSIDPINPITPIEPPGIDSSPDGR
jgi:hypothetical protein